MSFTPLLRAHNRWGMFSNAVRRLKNIDKPCRAPVREAEAQTSMQQLEVELACLQEADKVSFTSRRVFILLEGELSRCFGTKWAQFSSVAGMCQCWLEYASCRIDRPYSSTAVPINWVTDLPKRQMYSNWFEDICLWSFGFGQHYQRAPLFPNCLWIWVVLAVYFVLGSDFPSQLESNIPIWRLHHRSSFQSNCVIEWILSFGESYPWSQTIFVSMKFPLILNRFFPH